MDYARECAVPNNRWQENTLLDRSNAVFRRIPVLIAVGYAVVSMVWIAYSDRMLSVVAGEYSRYLELQTYKGWLFVAASALLIYFVLRGAWNNIFAAYESSVESERRLQLALTSASGGIWELDLTEKGYSVDFISDDLVRRLGLPGCGRLTIKDLVERRHPDDVEETSRKLEEATNSEGRPPYEGRNRLRCHDGSYRWFYSRGNVVASPAGKPQRMIGVTLDIDDLVSAEEKARHLLRYDPVTGLSRQHKFLSDVDAALASTSPGQVVAVVQVRLSDINRLVGDLETLEDAALIRAIGDRLHRLSGVIVSRLSSDVFAMATAAPETPAVVQHVIRDALTAFLEPLPTPDGRVKLRVQVGGAVGSAGGETAIGLLRNSGHALEIAERTTEANARWFNEQLGDEFKARNDMAKGLQSAVSNQEIECHFQPLVELRTGKTAGYEALARWRRTRDRLVSPDEFIPLAEELGTIVEIGEEVLRQACQAAASWPAPYPFVAVNVSPLQLEDPLFPVVVARVLSETGLSPHRLELEITENAIPKDSQVAMWRIQALRDLGVSVAIDDFGTGYSSLSLLSKMPFTRLKIDKSFVAGNGNCRENIIIVNTIIDLAKNLGLSITGEGVETMEQARLLGERGVDLAQGYHFSKPVAAEQAAALVTGTWHSGSGGYAGIGPSRIGRHGRTPGGATPRDRPRLRTQGR